MYKNYLDYYRKLGKPQGGTDVDPSEEPLSYKIIVDPFDKRFKIEKYNDHQFDQVVYDSGLLDLSSLSLGEQIASQREILREEGMVCTALLRNQDKRVVFIEVLNFDKHHSRACWTQSKNLLNF
jgi:hypothetical protein